MDKFVDAKGEELFVITDNNQLLKKKEKKNGNKDSKSEILPEDESNSPDKG